MIHSSTPPLLNLPLRRRQEKMQLVIKRLCCTRLGHPNLKGYQNPIIGSKVKAIMLDALILPIGGVAMRRVCSPRGYPSTVWLYGRPERPLKYL